MNNNSDEYFFYLFYQKTLFVFYINSPYDLTEMISDRVEKVIKDKAFWADALEWPESKLEFKFVFLDSEFALSSGSADEIVKIFQTNKVDVEIITMSIKSLVKYYPKWADIFIRIENQIDKRVKN